MFKTTRAIVTFATFISSTGISLAAGSPYLGASIGAGGSVYQHGLMGNIFGGYGTTYGSNQKWYVGGELNAHATRYNNYATTYGLGVSVLPGIMVTKSTMVYTRLGIDTTFPPHSTNLIEFQTQAGLGLQTELSKKIGLRTEYTTGVRNGGGQYNLGLLYKFD